MFTFVVWWRSLVAVVGIAAVEEEVTRISINGEHFPKNNVWMGQTRTALEFRRLQFMPSIRGYFASLT